MPSIRETAVSKGLSANRTFSGSPVAYVRGATSIDIERAVKRSEEFATLDQSGQEQIITATIWRVPFVDIESLTEPAIGDVVTDENDVEYMVESPGGGVLHWRYTDTGRTEVTIYTREVGFHKVSAATQRDLSGNEVRRP